MSNPLRQQVDSSLLARKREDIAASVKKNGMLLLNDIYRWVKFRQKEEKGMDTASSLVKRRCSFTHSVLQATIPNLTSFLLQGMKQDMQILGPRRMIACMRQSPLTSNFAGCHLILAWVLLVLSHWSLGVTLMLFTKFLSAPTTA